MEATHTVTGSLVQVNGVAILVLEQLQSFTNAINLMLHGINIVFSPPDVLICHSDHLHRLPHQVFIALNRAFLVTKLV